MKKKYLIKTKYGNFNASIWRDNADEKMYLVEVPSFNKTMTQGTTLADAKYMAKDLIELLCEVAFDDGKVVIDDERHIVARGKLGRLSGVVALTA
ncbi:type II toxin-antitoxin system HicB family antitoxin [Candidatus Kaiserbacteria bacterium]|nr:type II toxin-antitoxin system HicB family antitoxin [Candidatus Kaiserbacteria bacterium]